MGGGAVFPRENIMLNRPCPDLLRGPFLRGLITALSVSVVFLLASCGPAPRIPEPDNLIWPLPPEQPRIKYIQSIYSEDDIGRVYSLREKLFGKSYFDKMVRPYGVYACHSKIYVTDIAAMRVFVFDLMAKKLRILGQEGAVKVPSAVVDIADGTTFVADAAQGKIAVYDAGGNYKTAFPMAPIRPVALAVNEALGRLYVVDRSAHKVVVLKLDGTPLFEFGAHGYDDGQFNMPLGITIDRTGTVYVLDSGNFRVQLFDPDGKFITQFGSVGDGLGFFANPKGIAVDSEDHIYVTDVAFNNVQIFDREGNILLFVGGMGSSPGQMFVPAGVSIDEEDRIYVADQLNGRVQVFQYLKSRDAAASSHQAEKMTSP